ncbi:hypothetical protein FQN54_002066 [Arachnomyces sp. PD_36]|nr:hypothetical protein FQN54_002066 [Arachnomyces sp. PD_36]
MSSEYFRVVEHEVPCQHIREYPRATSAGQEDTLSLAVKQYIPLDNLSPQPGDITVIGAHANGFCKELYEPLWDEIHARSKQHGFRIRSIWIADFAVQGQSYVSNEDRLGNDPSWFDHSRDLLNLVNLKRADMPRPIIGIGHSMGGNQLVNLALMHPRLLSSLVLMDPVIQRHHARSGEQSKDGAFSNVPMTAKLSSYRRDVWPSREDAAQGFKKSKFYQAWDPRVLDRYIQHGLRDLPTAIHPSDNVTPANGKSPVTLTTPLHQEVFTFVRPNYTKAGLPVNRVTHPDLDPTVTGGYPFYRPEPPMTFYRLPHLRPSVMYVFGDKSELSTPALRKDKMDFTGTGYGGSGGAVEGRVQSVCFEGMGHLFPLEIVDKCADVAADWVGAEMRLWREQEAAFNAEWSQKSSIEKATIDEAWKQNIGPPLGRKPQTQKPNL